MACYGWGYNGKDVLITTTTTFSVCEIIAYIYIHIGKICKSLFYYKDSRSGFCRLSIKYVRSPQASAATR